MSQAAMRTVRRFSSVARQNVHAWIQTAVLAALLAASVVSPSQSEAAATRVQSDDQWGTDFTYSTIGTVYASAEYKRQRIAAGGFTSAGLQTFNKIAGWDGASWWALGQGVAGGDVNALTVYGDLLIAGGSFTTAGGLPTANRIASWDGTEWHLLGSGMNGTVLALAVYGTDLVAAGSFTFAGGVPVRGIAKWNGSNWSPLGTGLRMTSVTSLASYNGELYVGGTIDSAGSVDVSNIARWNGVSWNDVGTGVDNQVNALTVHQGKLVAAGWFLNAGGSPATRIAQWTGSNWVALGPGVDAPVNSLVSSGSQLHVGGNFVLTGSGVPLPHLATWNGSSWSTTGSGCNGNVTSLLMGLDGLYAWGAFSSAGGLTTLGCARFDGANWVPLGQGLNGEVYALAAFGGRVAATGKFTLAGGKSVFRVALWDTTHWSPLGSGLSGTSSNVSGNALATYDGDLVVAGEFSSAGGVFVSNIAAWGAGTWKQLGAGCPGPVNALIEYQGKLVATGTFGVSVWDGIAWAPLGTSVTGTGYALAVRGSDLIVGGTPLSAGGPSLGRVIRWNGSAWSAVGSLGGTVHALGVWRDTLVAGGAFSGHVSRWTGTSWVVVGGGTNTTSTVRSINVYFDRLIIAGNFDEVGPYDIFRIAQYDGTSWSSLGSGLSLSGTSDFGLATLVAPRGFASTTMPSLFVGGAFRVAGIHGSAFIARWDDYPGVAVGDKGEPELPRLATINAWPNPSTRETRLAFGLPRAGEWALSIHDSQGREVRRARSSSPAGQHEYRWDGRDANGNMVAAGIYFARIQASGQSIAGRIVRLR